MIALYCTLWLIEFALFGLQRGLLLFSREHDVEFKHVVPLLPGWFGVAWLVKVGNWGLLGVIAWTQGIWLALGVAAAGFVLSAALPIPYRVYYPLVRKQAMAVMRTSPAYGMRLLKMLEESQVFRG